MFDERLSRSASLDAALCGSESGLDTELVAAGKQYCRDSPRRSEHGIDIGWETDCPLTPGRATTPWWPLSSQGSREGSDTAM